MIDSPRVCVQVQSVYIESQSTPDEERFVFAYTVTIRNRDTMKQDRVTISSVKSIISDSVSMAELLKQI